MILSWISGPSSLYLVPSHPDNVRHGIPIEVYVSNRVTHWLVTSSVHLYPSISCRLDTVYIKGFLSELMSQFHCWKPYLVIKMACSRSISPIMRSLPWSHSPPIILSLTNHSLSSINSMSFCYLKLTVPASLSVTISCLSASYASRYISIIFTDSSLSVLSKMLFEIYVVSFYLCVQTVENEGHFLPSLSLSSSL